MLSKCGAGKGSLGSLGLQGDQTSQTKRNLPWIFIGKTDAEAEAPILWPPDTKSQLIWKDPDAGKDWRWEEKGTREDEMVRWHHWFNGHEFEHTPGDGESQGSLACYSPLCQWCHPTVSSSIAPFFSCPQSCTASVSFPMSWLFVSGGQSIGASASASVLPMSTQDWFPLGLTGLVSLLSKGLSRVFSSTTVQRHEFFSDQPSLWSNSLWSNTCTWLLEKL